MRIALFELVGYREWTESLGHDREWIIQHSQASLYSVLQREAAALQGHAAPLRYDYLLAVTTGIGVEGHHRLLDAVRLASRMPVRVASVAGARPAEVLDRAYRLLSTIEPGTLHYEPGGDGVTVIAHVDINGISAKTRREGMTRSLVVIAELISQITSLASRHGGIAQYLGGDNIIVLLPDEGYEAFAQEAVNIADVKVGIGVALLPRRAMMLSSKALHMIREERVPDKINILVEGVG